MNLRAHQLNFVDQPVGAGSQVGERQGFLYQWKQAVKASQAQVGRSPWSLTPIPRAAGDGDRKLTAEEEEARRIAEMGKPVLGENCRLEVIIEESYDFKVIFWDLTFLESCLGHFLGESPGGDRP